MQRLSAIILALVCYLPGGCSGGEQQFAQDSAVEQLASANSMNALRAAVGHRGCVYVYADKSWVAVWYERWEYEHAKPGQDQYRAVALDSEGKWFQSRHRCGPFVLLPRRDRNLDRYIDDYRKGLHPKDSLFEFQSAEAGRAGEEMMYLLTNGPNLSVARRALLDNGFAEFTPQRNGAVPKIAVSDTDITVPKSVAPEETKAEDEIEYQFGGHFAHNDGVTSFTDALGFSDDGVAILRRCPEIEAANLVWGKISDRGLGYLRELPHLRKLSMDMAIGDAGLAEVGKLTELETLTLNLDPSSVTDVGIGYLRGLTHLASLKLIGTLREFEGKPFGCKITARAIQNLLGGLPQLRELRLMNVPIDNAAMTEVGKLHRLEVLELSDTSVTDSGIASLSGLSKLHSLNVTGNPLTDAAIPSLERLPALRELNVGATQMSEDAVVKFRGRRRDLTIHGFAKY